MTDSWLQFRLDLAELKDAGGMNYRAIEDAGRAADAALPRSTVNGLMQPVDRPAGRSCTGQLEDLVDVLLAHAAHDDPAAAPWRDRASWQRRWEELEDDRSPTPAVAEASAGTVRPRSCGSAPTPRPSG